MITQVLGLTRWEWFKFRRRWMPWIMLGIIILITQAFVWGFYGAYRASDDTFNALIPSYEIATGTGVVEVKCSDLLEPGAVQEKLALVPAAEQPTVAAGIQEWQPICADYVTPEENRGLFTLPVSAAVALNVLFSFDSIPFAIVLLMILVSSALGSEYGWGTLRAAVSGGSGRHQLLASKMLLMILLGIGAIIIVCLFVALSSVIAQVIPSDRTGPFHFSAEWVEFAKLFGKTIFTFLPYVAIATFLTVLSQSSATGMAGSLGYLMVDSLVAPPLLRISDTTEKFTNALLSQNVRDWMYLGDTEVAEVLGTARNPDVLQGFLVILAYVAVFSLLAFWIFQKRDIGGARGG